MKSLAGIAVFLALAAHLPGAAPLGPGATDYWVSPAGSDSNSGTSGAPFATIGKAASVVAAGGTVHVGPGTYAENVVSVASGTASARIAFVSDTKWGAKIVPPSGSTDTAWWSKGAYTDISDFEIDGRDRKSVV